MAQEDTEGEKDGDGAEHNAMLRKFYLLLFVGLLVVYAKFLWPLVFGRMHKEGVSFVAAVQDISLHAAAFVALTLSWVFAALWVYLKGRAGI